MVLDYLDSSLRVETLSFEEAADFNPREWFIFLVIIIPRGLEVRPPTTNALHLW
jgi:hypothetical protein